MPSFNWGGEPGDLRLPVKRGDVVRRIIPFYTAWFGTDDPRNVPLDITGRTWVSSIATGKDGTVITGANPTITPYDPVNGKLLLTMTTAQTDLLVNPIYWWDLIENPGTEDASILEGRMTVSGRATP